MTDTTGKGGPVTEGVTTRELLLRLENVTKAQESTAARIDHLANTLEDRYVSRREFDLRVGEIEKDQRAQEGFRRQVLGGFAIGLLLMLANIMVNLARVPGVS
jgi:hypothetical protein